MRGFVTSVLFGAACLVALPRSAEAHGGFGYGGGWYGGYGGFGSYYGGGGHDFAPHWHTTRTPYGVYRWYGTGMHDYMPHHHTYTPWSYRSHSYTPWGVTTSHHPRYPYYFAPW